MMKRTTEKELIFDIESIDQLSPEKKADYIQLAIKDCLSKHTGGITTQLLSELTGISSRTVKKYLDHLTATREVTKKEYGARFTIYYPIEKKVTADSSKSITIGESIFHFGIVENTWGKFVYIQEKKIDTFSGMIKTVGGIMVDSTGALEFIRTLKEMAIGNNVISDESEIGEL